MLSMGSSSDEHSEGPPPSSLAWKKRLPELLVAESLSDAEYPYDDYYAKILGMTISDDESKRIHSSFVRSNDARLFLLRDATDIDARAEVQAESLSENYLKMGVNYTLALRALLEARGVSIDRDAEEEINGFLAKFLAGAQQQGGKYTSVSYKQTFRNYFLEYVQETLSWYLSRFEIEDTKKARLEALDRAKDWVALEHEPMSMVTVTHLSGRTEKTILQIDEPIYALTPEQKKELDEEQYPQRQWYQQLDGNEQALFHHYRLKILAGRVIPGELRFKLPFLKGAYKQRIVVLSGNEVIPVSESFHCAALPYLDQENQDNVEMQRIARQNVEQLLETTKRCTEPDRSSQDHMITFGSTYCSGVSRPVKEIAQPALRERGCQSSNLCLGSARYVEANDYTSILSVYDQGWQLQRRLSGDHEGLADQFKRQLNELQAEIGLFNYAFARVTARLPASAVGRCLGWVLSAITFFPRLLSAFCDRGNASLQIVGKLIPLVQSFNEAYEKTGDKTIPKIHLWLSCSSGRHRTGLAQFHGQCEGVHASCPDLMREDVRATLSAGYHMQRLNGFQSGAAGVEGIHLSAKPGIPEDYSSEVGDRLCCQAAGTTSVAAMLGKLATQRSTRGPQFVPHDEVGVMPVFGAPSSP